MGVFNALLRSDFSAVGSFVGGFSSAFGLQSAAGQLGRDLKGAAAIHGGKVQEAVEYAVDHLALESAEWQNLLKLLRTDAHSAGAYSVEFINQATRKLELLAYLHYGQFWLDRLFTMLFVVFLVSCYLDAHQTGRRFWTVVKSTSWSLLKGFLMACLILATGVAFGRVTILLSGPFESTPTTVCTSPRAVIDNVCQCPGELRYNEAAATCTCPPGYQQYTPLEHGAAPKCVEPYPPDTIKSVTVLTRQHQNEEGIYGFKWVNQDGRAGSCRAKGNGYRADVLNEDFKGVEESGYEATGMYSRDRSTASPSMAFVTDEHHFELQEDDCFNQVQTQAGAYLDGVQFSSRKGRNFPHIGSRGGDLATFSPQVHSRAKCLTRIVCNHAPGEIRGHWDYLIIKGAEFSWG